MKTKIGLNRKTKKAIDNAIGKLIKDYGCVLMADQFDDEDFVKECEKTGHKKWHDPKTAYNIEINC